MKVYLNLFWLVDSRKIEPQKLSLKLNLNIIKNGKYAGTIFLNTISATSSDKKTRTRVPVKEIVLIFFKNSCLRFNSRFSSCYLQNKKIKNSRFQKKKFFFIFFFIFFNFWLDGFVKVSVFHHSVLPRLDRYGKLLLVYVIFSVGRAIALISYFKTISKDFHRK